MIMFWPNISNIPPLTKLCTKKVKEIQIGEVLKGGYCPLEMGSSLDQNDWRCPLSREPLVLWNPLGKYSWAESQGTAGGSNGVRENSPDCLLRQIGRTGTKRSIQRQGTEGLTHHFNRVVLSLLPLCSIRWPRWQLADKRSRDNTLAHYNHLCVTCF